MEQGKERKRLEKEKFQSSISRVISYRIASNANQVPRVKNSILVLVCIATLVPSSGQDILHQLVLTREPDEYAIGPEARTRERISFRRRHRPSNFKC